MSKSKLPLVTTPPEKQSNFRALAQQIPAKTAAGQRALILAALRQDSVTTFEAMRHLGIYDPRPRISELRDEGYDIVTTRVLIEIEIGETRRVGMYVLRSEPSQKERATNGEVGGSVSLQNAGKQIGGQTHG